MTLFLYIQTKHYDQASLMFCYVENSTLMEGKFAILSKQEPLIEECRNFWRLRNSDNADKKYEDHVCQLMASLLYPHLDFAAVQSRTESGVLIWDLIFYNNRSFDFLKDIYDNYQSRQIVMELKNVTKVEREHINQLNRYLTDSFGGFGILITRNLLPKPILKNTIDLWSGQRKCIISLTDEDLKLLVSVYERNSGIRSR